MLQGTSSFLVPRDTPGLTVARCNETMGCRFMNNGELVFEDCRVPEDHLLAENDALGQAGVYFRPGKIIQAAKNLGVGVAAFERTADYVQNYVQGGRILIKHQVVASAACRHGDQARSRPRAAGAGLARGRCRCAGRRCAVQHGQGVCVAGMLKVAQHALELHGGNGVMLDFGIEKLFRDAAIFLHMDATVDISHVQDRQVAVSRHRRALCRPGGVRKSRRDAGEGWRALQCSRKTFAYKRSGRSQHRFFRLLTTPKCAESLKSCGPVATPADHIKTYAP